MSAIKHTIDKAMDEAARSFIDSLATKSAGTDREDVWYCVAACAFAACNQGQYLAEVYARAIQGRHGDTEYLQHILRRIKAEPGTTDARGIAYMRNIFRADLDPFLDTMDAYWPDLRTLVVTTIYGYYQSDVSVVDALTTSQLNIATLVPMDVTAEVAWHMRGTIRNGGTREDLDFAFDVAMEIVRICDVRLRNTMPKPEEVINEERLF